VDCKSSWHRSRFRTAKPGSNGLLWKKKFAKMEVRLKPYVQAKLEQMARESGRPSDELVEDAVIGYFDELAQTRELFDRRFDDLESGRVTPIDGEEAYRRLIEKTQRQRNFPA
jgi:hypothetical protein